MNGGLRQMPKGADAPSHWLAYFGANDLEADVSRIGELGGLVIVDPTEVPSGRFLVAQDPQGAFFALFEGEYDD